MYIAVFLAIRYNAPAAQGGESIIDFILTSMMLSAASFCN